ncbi:MAG TPA: hypothetical protein VJ831_09230 [Jatrophihabitantaceae bacterium]|nr:hypothetical protein [Jatrophihabitantaceae bacterium]
MAWFRRAQEVPPPPVAPEPDDTPAALSTRLADLVAFVNRSAGRLPVEAVVAARRVTDVVREILDDAAADAVPDVHVIIAVRGMVDDYLPTTLRTYLALDSGVVHEPSAHGVTPAVDLVEQLDGLWLAGLDVLRAAQARDVDRLVTQGNFLRTKFSGSDLDL